MTASGRGSLPISVSSSQPGPAGRRGAPACLMWVGDFVGRGEAPDGAVGQNAAGTWRGAGMLAPEFGLRIVKSVSIRVHVGAADMHSNGNALQNRQAEF